MTKHEIEEAINQGRCCMGIELGSTRIKAALIGPDFAPVASGEHVWENRYENGVWTYSIEDVWDGLRDAYRNLFNDVESRYSQKLCRLSAMGVSGMMHGYLPLDGQGESLVPFRTWRNTITGQAAAELTDRFSFNIPQRWSIAHLYQAILNGEEHVKDIAYLTTLAGYIHYKLTGRKALGVGEASGMFPVDSAAGDYDETMLSSFDSLVSGRGYPWKLRDILPEVLSAGEDAGTLTEEGVRLLDPLQNLKPGIPVAPPEGDAGTGMTATNAVAPRSGNVSAGTSVFAMIALEKPLSKVYPEIDMVTTPTGCPVAMVHCNNCTNEVNAWAEVFRGFLSAMGQEPDMGRIFHTMFRSALDGEPDAGGLVLYNALSGEPILGLEEGRPLLVRTPEAALNFPNFMRAQLYGALAALKLGMDILTKESVRVERLSGHGGFFKTPEAGQRIMAAVTGTPVSVMETAGEGGAWGMALLAAFRACRNAGSDATLEDFLATQVFAEQRVVTVEPRGEDLAGFQTFMERFQAGLAVEQSAVKRFR